jgi:hypothetical protein
MTCAREVWGAREHATGRRGAAARTDSEAARAPSPSLLAAVCAGLTVIAARARQRPLHASRGAARPHLPAREREPDFDVRRALEQACVEPAHALRARRLVGRFRGGVRGLEIDVGLCGWERPPRGGTRISSTQNEQGSHSGAAHGRW